MNNRPSTTVCNNDRRLFSADPSRQRVLSASRQPWAKPRAPPASRRGCGVASAVVAGRTRLGSREVSRRSGALVLGNEILSAMPAGIPPAQTARAEAVQRQIHETNMREADGALLRMERADIRQHGRASLCVHAAHPPYHPGHHEERGGFMNVVAIITCLTLALVSHLYIIRSHGQQYIAYREQIVCSVRVLAVMSCVMMCGRACWDLSRQQLVCSRLLFGFSAASDGSSERTSASCSRLSC